MKLSPDFVVHASVDGVTLVPLGGTSFNGVVRGNSTLGAILELLSSETTEEDLIAGMCSRYNTTEDVVASDVARALAELRRIGAIDE